MHCFVYIKFENTCGGCVFIYIYLKKLSKQWHSVIDHTWTVTIVYELLDVAALMKIIVDVYILYLYCLGNARVAFWDSSVIHTYCSILTLYGSIGLSGKHNYSDHNSDNW